MNDSSIQWFGILSAQRIHEGIKLMLTKKRLDRLTFCQPEANFIKLKEMCIRDRPYIQHHLRDSKILTISALYIFCLHTCKVKVHVSFVCSRNVLCSLALNVLLFLRWDICDSTETSHCHTFKTENKMFKTGWNWR